jgi:dipeptidyl aminopeptidase/acylaminoacyl peptidase
MIGALFARALRHPMSRDVELALFRDMPHGIAGWSKQEVTNMIERMKGFIAQRLTSTVAAS